MVTMVTMVTLPHSVVSSGNKALHLLARVQELCHRQVKLDKDTRNTGRMLGVRI